MKLGEGIVKNVIPGMWVELEDGPTLMMDLLDPNSRSPMPGDTVAYHSDGRAAVSRFEVTKFAPRKL